MFEEELVIYPTNKANGFKVDYDYIYQKSRRSTNWNQPTADMAAKINFLNQFRCRLPYNIIPKLEVILEQASPLFEEVRDVQIQDLCYNPQAYQVATNIFEMLKGSVSRFRETAAGKFMHMTNPNLFVMIDSVIGLYMQCRGVIQEFFLRSDDYVRLLRFYCEEVNQLLEDVMQRLKLDRQKAISCLRGKDRSAERSIPRIVDKHFYYLAMKRPPRGHAT